ncbi:MAG: hypothetical protein BEN19_01890 [Epulopiscium sp. Nuni2H_MBin003]|nr:MAG: hypothetical protein BEN19_01890 [Epulopiscium sp. Nuni2H_MBin003]
MIKFTNNTVKSISVPVWFIKNNLGQINSSHLKVYLLLLSYNQLGTDIDIENFTTSLDMLYKEVISTFQALSSQRLIEFTELSADNFEIRICDEEPKAATEYNSKKSLHLVDRPEYSYQELNEISSQNSSIAQLFSKAQQILGRPLSPTDLSILFSFHDWLHMPIGLIEFLLTHCANNNHRKIRYIEKTAISWVEDGIMDIETANIRLNSSKIYFQILNQLGIKTSTITDIQKKYLDKWLVTFQLPIDIILEGCNRTTLQISNPNLKYLDKILTNWHDANVKTLTDIEELDKLRTTKSNKPVAKTSNKSKKYNNMLSHNWDYAQIELLEKQYHDNIRNGGYK